jgi:hypothetical protein
VNCRNCGTELPTGAMFCGECGATVTVPRLVEPAARARAGDTVAIQPVLPPVRNSAPSPRQRPATVEPQQRSSPAGAGGHDADSVEHVAGPDPDAPGEGESGVGVAVEVVDAAAEPPRLAEPAPALAEPAPRIARPAPQPSEPASRFSESAPRVEVLPPAAAPAPPSRPLAMPPAGDDRDDDHALAAPVARPAARPAVDPRSDDHLDVEATRIVRGAPGGDRFVLQFSTGENAIVFGSGLVGRNPVLEPGESVEQLLAIVDPGKSVSKTHLEFGQDAGRFWVSDRFSANGTIVRQPDAQPQRLAPGRRQQVVRGTRIDMGEQFFVVS